MKSRILLSFLAVIPLVLPALASAQNEKSLKIISSLPLTGSSNAQASSIVNGIKMAITERGNKVGEYTIFYESWDDASPARGTWDPAVEASNADKAIQDKSIIAYIGPYNSGAAKISMPKLNQAGLLIISPSATWPGLTKPGIGEPNEPQVYRPTEKVNFFRVVPADDLQGDVAAKWSKDLGVSKIFIVNDGELYGKGIAGVYKKSAEKLGLTILGNERIDPKASNYRSLAIKIKQQGPDLVYFAGTTQSNAGQFAKDLRSAGVNAKLMAPDGCYENAFIESAGKAALEGNTYITFGGVPAKELTGKGKDFYNNYVKTFHSEPEGYAAYGYESATVVLDAIARASTKDRTGVVQAVASTKDFAGVLGTWSFDPNGDTTLRTMTGNEVKDGVFVLSKVLN